MNSTRLANVKAARNSHRRAEFRTSDYPIEAFVEVAARCNLRCQMCAINYDARYQPHGGGSAYLEPELFARLRPMFPSLVRAYLFGLGEPTLNQHLLDYIRELSGAGVEVWFNTNATLIDEPKAAALAIAGADRITVSMDGATAQTYEAIRRGARFDAVLRGIRALVAASAKFGLPRVDLSMVAMASNVHELPLLVDLCADTGATGVHVEPLYLQPGSPELLAHYEAENLGNAGDARALDFFHAAQERAGQRGVHVQSRLTAEEGSLDYVKRGSQADWNCSEPWASVWVTSTAEVRACCTNEVSFGSLHERTIEQIWNGERFCTFRAQHARQEVADGCSNCIVNSRKRHSPFFRTLRAVTLQTPEAEGDVTDPLIVRGAIHATANPVDYELMIDETPIANLNDEAVSRVKGSELEMRVPVPFLTEGAHLLWTRCTAAGSAGSPREVYF